MHDHSGSTASALEEALAGAVAAVNTAQDRLRLRLGRPPAGPRWLGCAELVGEPARITGWAGAVRAWLAREYGEAPDRTVAGHLLGWYLMVPAAVAGLLFHTRRRVPALRPADLAFRLAAPKPQPVEVALLAPEFACLPDDPAAGMSGVTVVADVVALAALLRARFVGHAARFGPAFTSAFGTRVRFGPRTLWAAATDALDQALWVAGRDGGDEAAGVADAALVLPGDSAPLTSASTLRPVRTEAERTPDTGWIRRRESCCYRYVLSAGDGECRTCPRAAAGKFGKI